jgi:hypothetical protein
MFNDTQDAFLSVSQLELDLEGKRQNEEIKIR